MNHTEERAFIDLYIKAHERCFGKAPDIQLTEAESKHFSNSIQEDTGLTVGWKSIKNYSFYILEPLAAKKENPSLSTLDTLARYVQSAPRTEESLRKKNESHYPYWFAYLEKYRGDPVGNEVVIPAKRDIRKTLVVISGLFIAGIAAVYFFVFFNRVRDFNEDFDRVSEDTLQMQGWILRDREISYWNKRNALRGHLALFTQEGDNYAAGNQKVHINNLLLREIQSECFSTEILFTGFIPQQNWQQAGILLLEDTLPNSRNLRLSLGYNDFFGGYSKPGEIIIQAVYDDGDPARKPEELAHQILFSNEPSNREIIRKNLAKSALRIEKTGSKFRLLNASGAPDLFAVKEILEKELDFSPRFVGIFALKGFVPKTEVKPVFIDFFGIKKLECQ